MADDDAAAKDPAETPDQSPYSVYPPGTDAGQKKLPDPTNPIVMAAAAEAEEAG